MSEIKLVLLGATIFILTGCTWYYHQSTLNFAENEVSSRLTEEYGRGNFYQLSSSVDKVSRTAEGDIIGAEKQVKIQLKRSSICPFGFELLPKTFTTYEYGAVTMFIKCNVVE